MSLYCIGNITNLLGFSRSRGSSAYISLDAIYILAPFELGYGASKIKYTVGGKMEFKCEKLGLKMLGLAFSPRFDTELQGQILNKP